MSRQIINVIRYGSLPLLGVGLVQLKAETVSEPDRQASPVVHCVKVRELPIYGEPESAEYQLIPEGPSSIRDAVSVVRNQVWKFSDTFQSVISVTQRTYKTTEETFHNVVKFIKTEEGFYPRAGVISIAGLAGLVLARKGGIVRKGLYSGTLMTAAASLCYPYKAVQLARAEMEWAKGKVTDLYKGAAAPTAVEKVAAVASTDDSKAETSNEEWSGSEEEDGPSEVDHGQSKPEDKDMYTTRS